MKIKISRGGTLSLERAGKMVAQCCPFNTESFCDHLCPLFGEPEFERTGKYRDRGTVTIEICQGRKLVARIDDFTDERGVG